MKHFYFSVFLLFSFTAANAQWSADTMIRNPVCTLPSTQYQQQLCNDGNNGTFIVWSDLRTGQRIYAQHFDSAGYIQWKLDGIPVNDTVGGAASSSPTIATDSKGGAFVTWENDISGGFGHVSVTRINGAGTSVWGAPKDITPGNDNRGPNATPDGHGGIILNWYSYIQSNGVQIMVQWIDSTGRERLTPGGQVLSMGSSAHYNSLLATDGNYNAYIAFGDYDTLRVLKIDSGGNLLWGTHGKVLTTTFNDYSTNYAANADGKGGIIISWADDRTVPLRNDLYAQRVTPSGNLLWGANALLIDSLTSISNSYITVSPDENGGAFICMGYGHLYMQHVNAAGVVSWNAPIPVTSFNGSQSYPSMAADGFHGAIVAWDDGRDGTGVYAQRIDTTGKYLWQPSGAPVHTGYIAGAATGTKIISLNNGYAIAAMSVTSDIYAAKFTGQIKIATGVAEVKNDEKEWTVYPNPTSGVVYVQNNSSITSAINIRLFNSIGQLVQEQKLQLLPLSRQNVSLPSEAKGIYLISISSESGVSNYQIIAE